MYKNLYKNLFTNYQRKWSTFNPFLKQTIRNSSASINEDKLPQIPKQRLPQRFEIQSKFHFPIQLSRTSKPIHHTLNTVEWKKHNADSN